MSLWLDFLRNDQRLILKWKHYFPVYEQHFKRFINRDVTVIEIGVWQGGSLQMWKRYFGPHARIIGVDIDPNCSSMVEDQVDIRIGDQSDPKFLTEVVDEFGAPDIVLDDGSHMMSYIRASFSVLYPKLARN